MAEQIYADGPIDAPAKYVVPGSSEIVPIAVQAVLDGTNASNDFVPTLIFRSQAGHVIARVPTETTVVAGASAEVSWFPGVKRSAASAGTASLKYMHVVAGGGTNPQDPATIISFETNDPANYVQTDASHWTIPSVPQDLQILTIASATITTNGTITGGVASNAGFQINTINGTGFVMNSVPNHWFLQRVFEIGGTWHVTLTGTDTHLWAEHAWFFYVG